MVFHTKRILSIKLALTSLSQLLLILRHKLKHVNLVFIASNKNRVLESFHAGYSLVELHFELRNFELEIKDFQGSVACQCDLIVIKKFGRFDREIRVEARIQRLIFDFNDIEQLIKRG